MAQRLQQKRSSIAGRRPDSTYLEPGELAVNTNSTDPGLFFEGNDGSTVKVGPTAMGATKPATDIPYGNGEAWFNTQSKQLNLYDASLEDWQTILSPVYGGSEFLVFVGSEFPGATDALGNDGSASPFASFNRAVIEVAKRSILQQRDDTPKQNKYTIVLLPGTNIARNEPGKSLEDFTTEFQPFTATQELVSEDLRFFNPVEGGVILPRGTSVVGIDAFKSEIRPTYTPQWTQELYVEHIDSSNGYTLPAATGIFHVTGESLFDSVTFADKEDTLEVIGIAGSGEEIGVLTTLSPHGLKTLVLDSTGTVVESGDLVTLNYPSAVARTNNGIESVSEGVYYAEPLTETTLQLRRVNDLSVIFRSEFPGAPVPGSSPDDFFTLTLDLSTHHRLSCVKFATETILNEFYIKVQQAYSTLIFGDTIDDGEVTSAEINIGALLTPTATPSVDDVSTRPITLKSISLNSNFGLNGLQADGTLVGGFKQMNCFGMNYRAFNNDSNVYEVYYDQVWIPLKEATWRGLGITEGEVTNDLALQYLIDSVQIENLRYYLRPLIFDAGSVADVSAGVIDSESDTRHSSICSSNGAFVQTSEHKSTGAAVAFWAKNGGSILVEGAGVYLGEDSFRADGFNGIGTLGGAESQLQDFEIIGIRRPSLISARELSDGSNRQLIYLNSAIQSTTATTIVFTQPINTHSLLPYTLRVGSVIWVSDLTDGNTYSAKISAAGLSADGFTLNVESVDNGINGIDLSLLSVPYMRRFLDPRDPTQRNYFLHVRNTTDGHVPPVTGSVLRFAENQGSTVTPLLVTGRQLDPGENGGWNHLFTVHQAMSFEEGNNPNEINAWNHIPEKSDSYYVSLRLGDSYAPHLDSLTYAKGSYATLNQRAYIADYSEVEDTTYVIPSEERSPWSLARRNEYLQPVAQAYSPTGYSATADPNLGSYPTGSVYARGLQPSDSRYDDLAVLDYDDGTADFGLADTLNPNVASRALVDPDYASSRQAIARLLTVLGYDATALDTLLEPQFWINRDISTGLFPALTGNGYALSSGNWPVEFCTPSTIQAAGVDWRSPGMHNVSKGAPKYQTSTLGREMRFDAMKTSSFGGRVDVKGGNNFGEVLPVIIDTSRRTEDIF